MFSAILGWVLSGHRGLYSPRSVETLRGSYIFNAKEFNCGVSEATAVGTRSG